MILGKTFPATTLDEWLQIATKDLTAPAKARIRREIEAHYAAAVERFMENGVANAEAQTQALADLGEAAAAAKRFRRQHLTEKEARSLQDRLKYGTRWVWLNFIFAPLMGLFYYKLFDHSRPHSVLVCEVYALANMFFALARYFAANYQARSYYLSFLILIEIPEQVTLLAVLGYGLGWVILISGIVFHIRIVLTLLLWFKLRRIPGLPQELPPKNGAIA